MNRSLSSPRAVAAFTLIELLTVITIICILMAMLFPFIQGAKETARKRKADQDIKTICHAVEQYNVEYGQYPKMNPDIAPNTDDTSGDQAAMMTVNNSTLFNTLRDLDAAPNTNHDMNPRRQSFMDTKAVSDPANPRDGFLDKGGSAGGALGSMYDPWGTQYNIIIDATSDGLIDVSSYYTDFSGTDIPRATVGAFSLGKDKKIGKNGNGKYKDGNDYSDDQVSWASH